SGSAATRRLTLQVNEYREEHYRRVAWADDRFSTQIPGWKSDRGMVYVKFGPPDEKEEHPAEENTFAYERWRYRFIEGAGSDVVIEFVDRNADGSFRMTWDPDEKNVAFIRPQGLTLYDQLGAMDRAVAVQQPSRENMFERMRRFVEIRPRP